MVLMLVYVCWCSVAHESVTAAGAKLTSKLKAIGADEQGVEIAYTYSIAFVVRLHCWLILNPLTSLSARVPGCQITNDGLTRSGT